VKAARPVPGAARGNGPAEAGTAPQVDPTSAPTSWTTRSAAGEGGADMRQHRECHERHHCQPRRVRTHDGP